MKPEVIRETVMRFAADEWRAMNRAMCKPWQNAAGVAMATDGRIAICYHGAPQGMFETGCVADRAWSEQVLGWIRDDKADADKGLRPAIPLDFRLLALAADAAIGNARAHADDYVDDDDDDDEDTEVFDEEEGKDYFAASRSAVILPGLRREMIGGWYARIVAQTVATFGPCAVYGSCPRGARKWHDNGWQRILFAGECYEIVLMPLRHDMLTCEISIADAVTGELVQDYGAVSGSLDHLRFGKEARNDCGNLPH